jgi:endonuclease/exonuclease/phosphatase family metal-dependent hydrolase
MKIAIAARRKQLAQCIWLRRRIEAHLAESVPLILLGDLNDGPGLDVFEDLFGRSGVEIVMGWGEDAARLLYDPHAARALERRIMAAPTTARFYIPSEGRYLSALLDYIMVSPDLRPLARRWQVWHPFEDPTCWQDDVLRHALLTASDHFPVTVDLAGAG